MSDCPICCEEKIRLWGAWGCGHEACWECTMRLWLAGMECVMCKVVSRSVRVGRSGWVGEGVSTSRWEGVVCEDEKVAEKVNSLKGVHCVLCQYTPPDGSLKLLLRHYKDTHDKTPCKVCIAGRKQMFPTEHPLYTFADLKLHESTTEDCPTDPPNFLGHPVCRFCSVQCYDNNALYEHVTVAHYNCIICDSQGSSTVTSIAVYKDLPRILEHYRKNHHFCEDCHSENQGKPDYNPKTSVFEDENKLKLHQAKVHRKKISLSDLGSRGAGVAGDPEPAGHQTNFSIVFVHSEKKQETVMLSEDKKDRQQHVDPQGVEAGESSRGGRGRGRGRGIGRGGAQPAPTPKHTLIKQKFAVEFTDKANGMALRFNPNEFGSLTCYAGEQAAGSVTCVEYDENEEKLIFPELKKRVKIPKDLHAKGLANLQRLCREQEVSYTVIEAPQVPMKFEAKARATKELSPMTEEITEEVETLQAVYGDDISENPQQPGMWQVKVQTELVGRPAMIFMNFCYLKGYPDAPPHIEFSTDSTCGLASSCPLLTHHLFNGLEQAVLADYCPGEPIVYSCIEWVQENFEEQLSLEAAGMNLQQEGSSSVEYEAEVEPEMPAGLTILEGPPLADRKSKFVAHTATVTTDDEARLVVRSLRAVKRIAVAAHPTIYAYRIVDENGRMREGRDDDGEGGAADKLLFFLQRANVQNRIVVVTRWYGGIHLGPDRFKHILTVAKELLQQNNIIPEPKK